MTTHERIHTMSKKIEKKLAKAEANLAYLDELIADKAASSKEERKAAKAERRELHLVIERLQDELRDNAAAAAFTAEAEKSHPEYLVTGGLTYAEEDEHSEASIAAEQGRRSNGGSVNAAAREATRAAAEKVMVTGGSEGAITQAKDFAAAVEEGEATDASPEEIKAKVRAKRATREEMIEEAKTIDRADGMKVAEYNERAAAVGGVTFLTSDREKAKADARVNGGIVVDDMSSVHVSGNRVWPDAKPHVVEPIETDAGTEFVAGPASATDDIAAPAELPVEQQIERDHYGRPKIMTPDGKTRGYTRVTTYIDCLEDKSALDSWKLRTLLAGLVEDTRAAGHLGDGMLSVSAQRAVLDHEKALAKIAKRDRKGELDLGQFAMLRKEADDELKKKLDELASTALDLGGIHTKAQKGTDLHALTEQIDRGTLDILDESQATELVESGQATHADVEDLKAYRRETQRLGIEFYAFEKFVVDDDKGVAGTLDRLATVKLPGNLRRTKVVADLKTGRLDYGAGKIGMQLRQYAGSKGYGPANPTEREALTGVSRSKGLVIHLPAGEATCRVYVFDLDLAAKGLALAGEVRTWRNTGKRVVDLKAPLDVEAVAS
jgi:hypothetical protein